MPQHDDWRLQAGGPKVVMGHTFTWKRWHAPRPSWDHDHCALCNQELAEHDLPGVQHEGYADERDYHWLCGQCAQDFKTVLNLTLIGGREILPKNNESN
jgi:hypothetical protein